MIAGASIAALAGFLKAAVGAHEVITTIMLNWIAYWFGSFLFGRGGPLQNSVDVSVPISNDVVPSGKLPDVLGEPRAPGAAHRLLHRARRARRLLGAC